MRAVTHTETGREYQYLGSAVDCTNARDGVVVVLYRRLDDPEQIYVREQVEFWERFCWKGAAGADQASAAITTTADRRPMA